MAVKRSRGLGAGMGLAGLAWGLAWTHAVAAAEDALPGPSPETVLSRALDNLNATRHERVRMVNYRGSRKGLEREMEIWVKSGDAGHRVLGVFTRSDLVRGTSFLVMPPGTEDLDDGEQIPSNQYFIYVPALARVKRLSGAQRADSFFGTSLSQGDLEPHPASHYRLRGAEPATHRGEPALVLTVEPRFEAGYDTARFTVARDAAILRIEQFREESAEPLRVVEIRREWLVDAGVYVLPSRMRVTRGKVATEFEFFDRTVDPEIPDSMFSTARLLFRGD